MPSYEITTPQGTYEITVPEGTTERGAYDILQKQLGPQAAAPGAAPGGANAPDYGLVGNFLLGGARGVTGDVTDIVGALPQIGPENPLGHEIFEQMKGFANRKPGGITESLGNVAGTAAPFFLTRGGTGLGALGIGAIPTLAQLALAAEAYRHGGLPAAAASLWGLRSRYSPLHRLVGASGPLFTAAGRALGPTAEKLGAGAVWSGARRYFEGDGNGGSESGSPQRERPPVPADSGIAGSTRGGGERDNDSTADQRPDSRWADPSYFPQTESSSAGTR